MIKLKNLIKEVGEGTPYKYSIDAFDPKVAKEIIYVFTTDTGDKFDVNLTLLGKTKMMIDFMSEFSWDTTNKQDAFKIFTTIKAIITEAINKLKAKNINVNTLVYDATEKKGRIYKLFITKFYPNAKFSTNQYGSTEVKI